MQKAKSKFSTTLIIAILTLSMVLAAIPMASAAISSPTLNPSSGPVGTVVRVNGTGATPGLGVEIYWDAVRAWDGVKGYLNETTALGDGSYVCEVTIPEATAGTHYIIAYDVTSKTAAGAAFTVEPKIILTPTSGLPGDTVTVKGTGFAGASDVKAYFANSTTVTNSTENPFISVAANNTNLLVFNGTLPNAPIVPLSTNITLYLNATSYIYVIDDGVGNLKNASVCQVDSVYVNASGTITYTTGVFNFNVTAASGILNVTSNVNATYLRSLTTAYPATTTTTNSLGSFTASFTVPTVINENYTVRAIDKSLNYADAIFKVGPCITLTPTQGPAGAIIAVAGRGFTPNGVITSVTIDGTNVPMAENKTIGTDGAFSGKLVIPTVKVGAYNITVEDNGTLTATATFTVTGTTGITVSPRFGVPGATISISGENFTAIADTTVTVTLNTTPPTTVGTFKTNSA